MGKLRADLMKAQGRHEADDRCRDDCRHKRQAVVLGNRRIGQPIPPSRHSFQGARPDQPAQGLGMDARLGNLTPRDEAAAASEAQHKARGIRDSHVA
jgi:hypothetical protein